MSNISKVIQILTIGAGSASAKVLFEIQTSDSTPKRLIVARTSEVDLGVYHLDHAELLELGVFSQSVIDLYEDEWPVALTPQLTAEGTLPESMNAQFAQADFGTGKVGLIAHNGYDYTTGGFNKVIKKSSASAASTSTEDKWYQKPLTKTIGYVALAAGAVVGLVVWLAKRK